MEKDYFKKIMTLLILAILVVLTFLLIKPFLMALLLGLLLAFVFNPLYKKLNERIPSKNLSASIICVLFALIIIILLWVLTPILIKQSIQIFTSSQQWDFVTPLKNIFPSLFASEQFSAEIGSIIYSFVNGITNSMMNMASQLVLNFPTLFLQLIVVFFIFFFVLKDGNKLIGYFQGLTPFSKEIEKKLVKSSKDITSSILYGQVLLGLIQGFFVGIAFFLFGAPNALFLTLLAGIAGIFPIVGTSIIWIPVMIYFLVTGQILPMFGVLFFGLISTFIESFTKPVFLSKRTNVHSAIILLGMVGGLLMFGILGVIIGPLILSYLLILLESYRDKGTPGFIITPSK